MEIEIREWNRIGIKNQSPQLSGLASFKLHCLITEANVGLMNNCSKLLHEAK